MDMGIYDVVIVGAGPAGSTTAFYASKKNLNVLLIDKKKEIGHPVQCGEFLPTVDELKHIMPKVKNLESLFSIEDNMISKKTRLLRIFSPQKKVYELEFQGFSVERREFDKYLVEKAIGIGTELRTDTKFIDIVGSRIITSGGEFSAKVIVGADGYSSQVAKSVNLKGPKSLSSCILCEIPGNFEDVVEMHFGSIAPGGYAWIIPKADSANIGLGVQKSKGISLKKQLLKFLKSNDLKAEPRYFSGGYVPVSGPIPQTVKDNVLIVGDAAGHVMATNGGGIPIAMVCGRIAGNAIGDHLNSGAPLNNYEIEWKRAVGKELKLAHRTKRYADLFLKSNRPLEIAMRFMGPERMNRAVKCKSVFTDYKNK
jgi:digeranylgeranylglycerophospholipid reductase